MSNQHPAGHMRPVLSATRCGVLATRRKQPKKATLVTRAGAAIAAALLLFSAGGAIAQVDPVPAGALAHWTFDGNGSDVSGNGRNLDVTGSPRFTDAGCGQAIVLDGTQWAERPVDDQTFDVGDRDFTISTWFSVDDAAPVEQMLVSKWTPQGFPFAGWYLRYQGNGAFLLANGSTFTFEAGGTVVSGAWHHIVVQRSGTGFTMYLDSVLIGSHTSSIVFVDHTLPLHVGQRSSESMPTDETFRGKIDDIAISDRRTSRHWQRRSGHAVGPGASPHRRGTVPGDA